MGMKIISLKMYGFFLGNELRFESNHSSKVEKNLLQTCKL
jgi:hypothetical protein